MQYFEPEVLKTVIEKIEKNLFRYIMALKVTKDIPNSYIYKSKLVEGTTKLVSLTEALIEDLRTKDITIEEANEQIENIRLNHKRLYEFRE
jgi:hypothetical protein